MTKCLPSVFRFLLLGTLTVVQLLRLRRNERNNEQVFFCCADTMQLGFSQTPAPTFLCPCGCGRPFAHAVPSAAIACLASPMSHRAHRNVQPNKATLGYVLLSGVSTDAQSVALSNAFCFTPTAHRRAYTEDHASCQCGFVRHNDTLLPNPCANCLARSGRQRLADMPSLPSTRSTTESHESHKYVVCFRAVFALSGCFLCELSARSFRVSNGKFSRKVASVEFPSEIQEIADKKQLVLPAAAPQAPAGLSVQDKRKGNSNTFEFWSVHRVCLPESAAESGKKKKQWTANRQECT